MLKYGELYIGSISPTIGAKEQKALIKVSTPINPMLTEQEFKEILGIYGKAIDRILEENGITEDIE